MRSEMYKRLLGFYGLSLLVLTVLRCVFIAVHYVSGVAFSEVLKALGIGVVMDSSVMSCCILAWFLLAWVLSFLSEKVGKKALTAGLSLSLLTVAVVNVVDVFYFDYYATRLSYSLVSYFFENFKENFLMLWKGFPLPWVLLGALVLFVLLLAGIGRMFRAVGMEPKRWPRVALVVVTFTVLSFLYYGPPFWRLTTFSSEAMLNQAASNGAYTLAKSFSVSRSFPKDLFPFDEEELMQSMDGNVALVCSDEEVLMGSVSPTLRKFKQPKELERQKNVVVIIGESFSATLTEALGQDERSYAPCFDALCKEGALFSHCFSNGPRTQNGIVSVLSGFPSVLGSSLIRRRGTNAFFTLAEALKEAGYETNFIHNGDVDYDDMRNYLLQGGFQNIYGGERFDTWRFKNDWGVCDEDMFDLAFKVISEAQRPHLSVILTMSNHEPFDIPPYFSATHPEVLGFQKSRAAYYYSDYAFGTFMEKLKTLPDYENTLVLRTADHGEVYFDEDHQFRYLHIPALFLNASCRDTVLNVVCSQMDFATTILSEIGYKGAFPCIGRNLFSPDFHSFATMNSYNNLHYWVENGKVVTWDMMSGEAQSFRLRNDYLLEPSGEAFDAELERMKSYLAFLSFVYQKGLFSNVKME